MAFSAPGAPATTEELIEAPGEDGLALLENCHVIAQDWHVGEDVRREEDRPPPVHRDLKKHAEEIPPRAGIEAGGRLTGRVARRASYAFRYRRHTSQA